MSTRSSIRQNGGLSAGLWYEDSDGSQRQFAGVKVHSSTPANAQWGVYNSTNSWVAWFTGTGAAWAASWNVTSDARCKKDITPYADGLEALKQIRTVRYRYNGRGDTRDDGVERVGVIAQEVERVAPYMVNQAATNDPSLPKIKGVDASGLNFMLVNAVKALAEQNKQLRKDVDDLKRAVAAKRSHR